MNTTTAPVHAGSEAARIARQPVEILDYAVATDWDGCPVLDEQAPDVCENGSLPKLAPHARVHVLGVQGDFMCFARAAWAAREVAKGRLARVNAHAFRQVGR